MQRVLSMCTLAAAWLAACGNGDPNGQDASITDDPITGAACSPAPVYTEDVSACSPAASDYLPRENGSADDSVAVIRAAVENHQIDNVVVETQDNHGAHHAINRGIELSSGA